MANVLGSTECLRIGNYVRLGCAYHCNNFLCEPSGWLCKMLVDWDPKLVKDNF